MLQQIQQHSFMVIGLVMLAAVVLAAVVLAAVFSCRSRAQARQFANERAFYDSWDSVCDEVMLLVDAASGISRYAAGNSDAVLGLGLSDLQADRNAFDYCLADDDRRAFHQACDEWDRSTLFTMEVPYHLASDPQQAKRFARVTMRQASGAKCIMVTYRDITHEKVIRDQLAREADDARTSEREKSDFLSNMSHEIRTPMNGIMGMLGLAKMGSKEQPEVLGYLNQAEDLSTYLLSLINDILDMSKIESGKMDIERRPFDITDVLLSIDEIFRGMIEEKAIEFTVESDAALERYVLGDELRITQVITNLLSNAYKFTPEGGQIACRLHQVQVTQDTSHLLFEVSDTGKGMEPEFLDRIFNPFVQENSSISRKFGGTGLGMSITDNLVRLMGGQITVESQVGKGSTFRVYLGMPMAQGDQVAQAKKDHEEREEAHRVSSAPFQLNGCNVLMAEDNRVNAMIAEKMLLELGANVDVASNGQQAVDMFDASRYGHYGLILMDVQMPVMDGREATRTIRKLDRPDASNIPILALSANAYVEDMRESREAGMNGHLAKPIDFATLEQAIAKELMS